jgi:FtsP/CotA-like multicopper oxidase with cupredoxin domain
MKLTTLVGFCSALASQAVALPATLSDSPLELRAGSTNSGVAKRASCANTATSRDCWGDYSIDTNWYDETPDTGVIREYWLVVQNTTLAPDGFERYTLNFNGTIPGPTITADWGDTLKIHVTNNLAENGTAIHWHGIRQKGSMEYDGVPGVTQCPIAPGDTLTYEFQATQYGSTWYHSHFTLQYGDGLLGPLVINGPATANYDEDLGPVFLSDWAHEDAFDLWDTVARLGGPPELENGLINGKNTFNGGGERSEFTFSEGTSYRLRLVNTAIDGYIRFAVDNHTLTVIANDLVPIVPYEADSIIIGIGQRYDVVINATQTSGDYWMRAIWQTSCSNNTAGWVNDILAIVRYDSSSTADPTTTNDAVNSASACQDEPYASLVPHLALAVGSDYTVEDELAVSFATSTGTPALFTWTINDSSLWLNWSDPTILRIDNGDTIWPTDYNVEPVTLVDEWVIYVIENSAIPLNHPIHLHGHDFWVVAQESTTFDLSTFTPNLVNAPRRDVATLPSGGYLAIAFKTDNPGSWIMHCHIAWHASQGLAMQFVERESEIVGDIADPGAFQDTCKNWNTWTPTEEYVQDDSGI